MECPDQSNSQRLNVCVVMVEVGELVQMNDHVGVLPGGYDHGR
jgi:hypothetical protein